MSTDQIINTVTSIINSYSAYLPALGLSFIISIFITPLLGRFALYIKALDLPANLRGRNERNLETRINPDIHPKLGGLAIAICVLIISFLFTKNINPGIAAGILIITVYGFLDDKFDLSFRWQIIGQFLAAIFTVLLGTETISNISFLGIKLDSTINIFSFGSGQINLGQIITIVWIVSMINFVNWMGGVDGLNNAVSSIVGLIILAVGVSTGNTEYAILVLVCAQIGANAGNLIYIYPPAKLFTGTIGEHLNGYLLAVFALTIGAKSPVALVVLGLPLLDALVVMTNRIFNALKAKQGFISALGAATNGDRTHLHHRLLDAGFSKKGVLAVESSITLILGAASLYIWNITNNWAIVVMLGFSSLIIFIVVVITLSNRYKAKQIIKNQQQPKASVVILEEEEKKPDEQRFIY